MTQHVTIIGAGLAGSEAALQLAKRNIAVTLIEQRPVSSSPAHHTDLCAELVCSNSLKSTNETSAAGLLKYELRCMGSELLRIAQEHAVSAGGALAVDRLAFAQAVTQKINDNPHIVLERRRVDTVPDTGWTIVAAGPLCSDELFSSLTSYLGSEGMSFYDAAAPIVAADSLRRDIIFSQSRYEALGEGDYLNCPMNKAEYEAFIEALCGAQRVIAKDFETKDLFNACQPIEEVARTGKDAIRFGALKPVGLIDPRTQQRPWAAVQLRAENSYKTAYNLVGFQTNLTWPEQARVFRMIPGLEEAEFVRYGVMHRNSFVDAPHVLVNGFSIPGTRIRLAGQITGTEGYVEAIASGLHAALSIITDMCGLEPLKLPQTTAFGALVAYAQDPNTKDYQPMHVNFGIMPPLEEPLRKKDLRRARLSERAHQAIDDYVSKRKDIFGISQVGSV